MQLIGHALSFPMLRWGGVLDLIAEALFSETQTVGFSLVDADYVEKVLSADKAADTQTVGFSLVDADYVAVA